MSHSARIPLPKTEKTTPQAINGRHNQAIPNVMELSLPDGVTLPAQPRFAWRGLNVDVVRHWYGVENLYRIVDILAAYGFNIMHLHLTDDQGWRLEIPAYPALTEISGRTQAGGEITLKDKNGEVDKGYLSLTEYKELQGYAKGRGIIIVPEIDLPGHVHAALHAIPELNPDGKALPPYHGTEVGHSRLLRNNPATKPFIKAVLDTVSENTIGDYVHVGGDEVPLLPADEFAELVNYAREVVTTHGKTPVLWQEGAVTVTSPETANVLIQYWEPRLDKTPMLEAAQHGAQFIYSPANHIYLDIKYAPDEKLGLTWGTSMGPFPVDQARNWDPASLIPEIPESQITGVEGALWAETFRSYEDFLSMLFPRLAAVAEVAWLEPNPELEATFRHRAKAQADTWREWGVPETAINRL